MPFPRSATLRLAAATMAVALAACTSASTGDVPAASATVSDVPAASAAPGPADASVAPESSEQESSEQESSEDAATDDATAEEPAAGCRDDDRDALLQVVDDQLAAFAAEDFEAARELASASFRESIDLATFEELITEQYGVVLTDPEVAVEACATDGERAVLAVELAAPDGSTADVVYLLAREDGSWRIEGAQTSDVPGGGDLGVTV